MKVDLPSTTQSVPIALTRARESVMVPIRQMLANSGVTEQQWRVLRVLEEFGPLDATRLSVKACLLLPSQTRIVQTLTEKGLVSRSTSAEDRRKQHVQITSAGKRIILDNQKQTVEIAKKIENTIGKQRLKELLETLELLHLLGNDSQGQ